MTRTTWQKGKETILIFNLHPLSTFVIPPISPTSFLPASFYNPSFRAIFEVGAPETFLSCSFFITDRATRLKLLNLN